MFDMFNPCHFCSNLSCNQFSMLYDIGLKTEANCHIPRLEADPVSSDIGISSCGCGDKDPGLLGEDMDLQESCGNFD